MSGGPEILGPGRLILLDHNSPIVPTAGAELKGSSLDWRYPRGLDRVAGRGWVTGPPPPPPPPPPLPRSLRSLERPARVHGLTALADHFWGTNYWHYSQLLPLPVYNMPPTNNRPRLQTTDRLRGCMGKRHYWRTGALRQHPPPCACISCTPNPPCTSRAHQTSPSPLDEARGSRVTTIRILIICGILIFTLLPLQTTRGTLDSGIAIHSCTLIKMWISWTLGLQSIAQKITNKQVFRMIHVYQFFNEPVPYSSIIVLMAHEMLEHQWNFATWPDHFFTKPVDNSAQGTSNPQEHHRKFCRSRQQEKPQHCTWL